MIKKSYAVQMSYDVSDAEKVQAEISRPSDRCKNCQNPDPPERAADIDDWCCNVEEQPETRPSDAHLTGP